MSRDVVDSSYFRLGFCHKKLDEDIDSNTYDKLGLLNQIQYVYGRQFAAACPRIGHLPKKLPGAIISRFTNMKAAGSIV